MRGFIGQLLVVFVVFGVTCAAQSTHSGRPVAELQRLSVSELIRELDSANFDTSMNAARFLGSKGEQAKQAVPALTRAAMNEKSEIQDWALEALAAIGRPALPSLLGALVKYPNDARFVAIGEGGIIAMGRDVIPDVLLTIANAAKQPGPQAEDNRLNLRGAVIRVFQTFGLNALPLLVQALNHPDPWVRGEAAYWIEGLGSFAAPAAPALESALARTPEPHHALIAKALEKVR